MEMVKLLLAGGGLLLSGSIAVDANPPAANHSKHHGQTAEGVAALDVYSSGDTIDLLVTEKSGADMHLLHQRSTDRGVTWSAPVRVDRSGSPVCGARRGNDPQIVAAGGRLVAVWTTPGTDPWGSGPLATALSADGGKTWTAGPNPADDGSTTGHAFSDLAVDGEGGVHLVWLDSRDGQQGLRYAKSSDSGAKWSANKTIKPGTCECCSNVLASDGKRVGVLFRDHNPRDMRVSFSEDAGATWQTPSVAGNFGWSFNGCPHVAGGLAIAGDQMHAVVWTGKSAKVGVHVVSSGDQGKTWSAPQRLGPVGAVHPDLATVGSRTAATWEAEGAIWSSTSTALGQWTEPKRLSEAAGATHSRVIPTKSDFRAFWTEKGPNDRVVWKMRPIPE